MTLSACLQEVTDPRRAQGLRISLSQLFSIIVISNLCGHLGGRAIARFAKVQENNLTQQLSLKHPVPSHVTISDFINRVNQQEMIDAFNKWTSSYVPLSKGDLVSGDGKVLRSTVSNANRKSHDFQAIVSLFCQDSGLVYAIGEYQRQKDNEIDVVRFLLEQLKDMGLNLYLDALHCQKKQQSKS